MEASEEKPTVTITYDQELPDCPCSQEDLKDKLLEAHKLQHWKCSCNSGLSPECDELLHHINRIKKDLEARVDNHLECVCALGKNNNELFARIAASKIVCPSSEYWIKSYHQFTYMPYAIHAVRRKHSLFS